MKEKQNNIKKIINFLFEITVLKRIPRSGWRDIGIENPDSVAEHAFIVAQIAYILARMEGIDAEKSVLMALFHDNGEARIGDTNLLTKIYLGGYKTAEAKAFFEQVKNLPGNKEIKKIYQEYEERKTPEAILAKDADWLELAIQAKHYLDSGNKAAKLWIKHARTFLKTKSAKKIINIIEKTNIDDWWKEIPEMAKEVKKAERRK